MPRRIEDLALATALTTLAGSVDAIGFLRLGGLYVSFMSGNSTQLGAGLALGGRDMALRAATLIVLFVFGAFSGGVVGWAAGARRRAAVLLVEAGLLAGSVALGGGDAGASAGFGVGLVVFAMGMQNAALNHAGRVTVGATYVTGTLARLGEALAHAVTGEADAFGWAPYLLLWAGLAGGAAVGAALYARFGVAAVLAPALAAALLGACEALRPPAPAAEESAA